MTSKRMATNRATTSSGTTVDNAHLIDIHEEEEDHQENIIQTELPRQSNRPLIKPKRQQQQQQQQQRRGGFNRQVSLETGFSAMNRESNAREDRKKVLSRSGNSFGGFGSANGIDGIRKPAADFSIFRTKSTLGKQNSLLLPASWKANEGDGNGNVNGNGNGGPAAAGQFDHNNNNNSTVVPVGRYFAALRGPELDQVKDFEDILLPKDEIWPFLLRFPIGCFGICLGLSSQTILWQAMATSPSTSFLHVTPFINLALWLLSLLVLVSVSITYVLKCVYYFEAVRREYFHPVRVNFFFAPWIVCMFLVIGAPKMLFPGPPHPAVWCVFMGPVFCLELKIYGQWLSGGKRRLSKVANPSSHLSVVGNFVGAILAAKVGWEEPAKFLWAVGFAHYLVVFVTLYQRLPTSEALPKELHPVYCMFIAAPSAASIAWETIYGEFDGLSRTCYFIALFLYVSLVVRINFFWGFRFSVAWWSYTFPMTTASLATIKYAEQVDSIISKGLAVTLSFMSSTMVSSLLVSTLLHAFFWRTLFPNDLAIAITKRRVVVGKEGKDKEKEKKPATKKTYDIRRWAKQSPLNFVSSITKHNHGSNNETDDDGIKNI